MIQSKAVETVYQCDRGEREAPTDRAEALEIFRAIFGPEPSSKMSTADLWGNVRASVHGDIVEQPRTWPLLTKSKDGRS